MKVLHYFVPQLSADSPNALAVESDFVPRALGETSIMAASNRVLLTLFINKKFKFVRFSKGDLPGLGSKVPRLRSMIRSRRFFAAGARTPHCELQKRCSEGLPGGLAIDGRTARGRRGQLNGPALSALQHTA